MGLLKAVFTLRRANFWFWFKNAMGFGLCSLLKAVRLPIIVSFCVILVSCGELSLIGNHTTSSFFIKIKFWKIATGKSRYLKMILIYSFLLQVDSLYVARPAQMKRREDTTPLMAWAGFSHVGIIPSLQFFFKLCLYSIGNKICFFWNSLKKKQRLYLC